eukprot:SAG22_NODE_3868_length_1489_cov_1.738849_1_plen_59_part_10
MGFLYVVCGIVGVQMFKGLGTRRCEYGGFDLMAELDKVRTALSSLVLLHTSKTAPFLSV